MRYLDLWVIHEFKSRRVGTTAGCKVDDDICIGVLTDCLFNFLINGQLKELAKTHKCACIPKFPWFPSIVSE